MRTAQLKRPTKPPVKADSEWDDLVEREPGLATLLREAQSISPKHPDFCTNPVWYGYAGWPGLKPRLVRLVGDLACREDPVLYTSHAYDVAYQRIYQALPGCDRCGHKDQCDR
jgi:hypothetical protein